MTKVVNKFKEPYDTYIGRGSPFGNPFVIGKDGWREEVIEKYRIYFNERIKNDSGFRELVNGLKDKTLGCYCHPKKCHGDIIKEWLDKDENTLDSIP